MIILCDVYYSLNVKVLQWLKENRDVWGLIMDQFLPFSRPAIGDEEIAAVEKVLRSGWITTGPQNQQLESEFCRTFGCKHAVAVCSATAGMHITLMALDIGPGDEVITPLKPGFPPLI